jgi:hypothetical protein
MGDRVATMFRDRVVAIRFYVKKIGLTHCNKKKIICFQSFKLEYRHVQSHNHFDIAYFLKPYIMEQFIKPFSGP